MSNLFHTLSVWVVLLPAFSGLHYYRYLNTASKIIWGMSLLATIPQMINVIPFFAGKRYAFYNLYAIPEVILSFAFLWKLIDRKKKYNRIIVLFIPIFFVLYFFLFQQHDFTKRFFVECVATSNLMVLCGVLMIIYNAIQKEDFTIIKDQPESYFVIGLFFYAPLTVIIFTLWNFIHSHENSALQNLNNIHSIANFALYILFAIGIFKNRNQPRYSTYKGDKKTITL